MFALDLFHGPIDYPFPLRGRVVNVRRGEATPHAGHLHFETEGTIMGNCINCTWYESGYCHNPDCHTEEEWEKHDLEKMEPDDGCTLWEED